MKRLWDAQELAEHWSLSYKDLELLGTKPRRNHLGFCAQLKYYQNTGRFPERRSDIPDTPLHYLNDQLDSSVSDLDDYEWFGRSGRRHRLEIMTYLQIRKVTKADKHCAVEWLVSEILPNSGEKENLHVKTHEWFHARRMECPAEKELDRLITRALAEFEGRLFRAITESLSPDARAKLDAVLGEDETEIRFSDLKSDPGRLGLDSVLQESRKLRFLASLQLSQDVFKRVHPRVLSRYRQRIASETAWEVRRHPEAARYAMLAIFGFLRQREIIDGLIELFCQIVHKIGVRAERKVVKELLRDFQKVHGKNTLLFRIAEASLGSPDEPVREVVYPIAGEATLNNLVKEFKATGPGYKQQVHTLIRSSYSTHYRRMLPKLLEALTFRSNNQHHRPVLDALEWVARHRESKRQYYTLNGSIPIDGVIKPKWRDVVIEKQGSVERINCINYEICVLQTLRDKLRCKEIWVEGADRYRNPDEDLPADFQARRADYYRDLGHSEDAEAFVQTLKTRLTESLNKLNKSLPGNKKVFLKHQGKNRICITPLEPAPEPTNIASIKQEMLNRWSMTGLLDMIKEADLRIGFSQHFHSMAAYERLDRKTLQKRLLLCLYGMGTNAGLKRVSGGRHGISYKELRHVRRRYIHKAGLRNAISQVANAIFAARNPDIWGEGTTSCASDSKKFGAWDQNLMTEWHIRYGGRGVMIYWHVEKKATCIYSQLKRCSSSEVAAMIEGVLRHCTDLEVEQQYVDSHGQSEVAFAFCHLLGFDLLPRLKAIASQKLYRSGDEQPGQYKYLDPILSRPINWDLIRQQYDEMIKYATALKQGTADPEAILRRFTRNNVQHPTYKALAELGKAIKTLFLCRYLGAESLRREIHEGLNVVENWNSANAFIFYGKGGEVATNRLEDQELSVLSLHLLQICLVYVNTLMIQDILREPVWLARLQPEDFRALTPLIYSHINPYGIFELDMDARLPFGQAA